MSEPRESSEMPHPGTPILTASGRAPSGRDVVRYLRFWFEQDLEGGGL